MIALGMEAPSANYRRLDAQKIIETVQALHQRIERRFPGSGLGKVVAERSGHIMHAGLMSKLLRVRSAWDNVDMS